MPPTEPAFSLQSFPSSTSPALLRSITSATASAHLVLLGYSDGSAAIFDVLGNLIDIHRHRHASPVAAVALGGGATGDDIAATAAVDATICLSSTAAALAAKPAITTRAPAPVRAIAVDPRFASPAVGERVAYADESGRVCVFKNSWFGGREVVLEEGKGGGVYEVAWMGCLVAWATSEGVSVYDMKMMRKVCYVEAPVGVGREVSAFAAAGDENVCVSLSFEVDETEKLSFYGERTLTLYAAWSKAAKVVAIGPHVDAEVAGADGAAPEAAAPRFVRTTCLITPADMLKGFEGGRDGEMEEGEDRGACGSFMGIASFGEHVAILAKAKGQKVLLARMARTVYSAPGTDLRSPAQTPAQTPSQTPAQTPGQTPAQTPGQTPAQTPAQTHAQKPAQLHAHSTQSSGESSAQSSAEDSAQSSALSPSQPSTISPANSKSSAESGSMCMNLPHGNVKTASLHAIPGGEPMLLIVVEKTEDAGHSSAEIDPSGANEADREDVVASVSKEQVPGTELALSTLSSKKSFAIDEDSAVDLSQSCVLFSRALGVAEKIKWLLEHGQFEDALTTAEVAPRGSLRRADVSVADVGDQFLASIRASGDFVKLADILPRVIVSTSPTVAMRGYEQVMKARRERWVQWIKVFNDAGKLDLVARAIPCFEPRMSGELYNETLFTLTETDAFAMLDVLKTWPADVYDVELVTRAVESRSSALNDAQSDTSTGEDSKNISAVREALFMLYGLSGRHSETLDLLLLERSDEVFSYIKAHDLYDVLLKDQKGFRLMYEIDEDRATELLLIAPETLLPVEAMIPIFRSLGKRVWFCRYLNAIFRQDSERLAKNHDILLALLVEHGREGELYSFLRTSSHYSLDTALKLMGGRTGKEKGLFGKERVYVLATMGDLNSAMDVLLVELHDVHAAIEFASEHSDVNLWDRLIEHARVDADTLAALLDSPAGGKVNPVRLIPLIASDMEIPFLRDRLHRILVDAALERALREETAAALHFDAEKLMQELDDAVAGHAKENDL